MATRNVLTKQRALKLAGDRRRELDRARGVQDKRVEKATAATLLALEVRDDAVRALAAAQSTVGEFVRQMLAEDISIDRAAALLDVDSGEVRQLAKAIPTDAATARGSRLTGPGNAASETVGRDTASQRTGQP